MTYKKENYDQWVQQQTDDWDQDDGLSEEERLLQRKKLGPLNNPFRSREWVKMRCGEATSPTTSKGWRK